MYENEIKLLINDSDIISFYENVCDAGFIYGYNFDGFKSDILHCNILLYFFFFLHTISL